MNAGNKNMTSMHHPRRQNVTTSMVGVKTVIYTKISPRMVNPRGVAGNAEEEETFIVMYLCACMLGVERVRGGNPCSAV